VRRLFDVDVVCWWGCVCGENKEEELTLKGKCFFNMRLAISIFATYDVT